MNPLGRTQSPYRIARQRPGAPDPRQPVAIALDLGPRGNAFYHRVYSVDEHERAAAHVARIRRTGVRASLHYITVPPALADLWAADMFRPRTVSPNAYYGRLGGRT